MKLTVEQMLGIHAALSTGFNGTETVVEENGKQRVVTQPFNSISGKARMALACNQAAVEAFVKSYNTTRNEMLAAKGGVAKMNENQKVMEKFMKEIEELSLIEHDVSIVEIEEADLMLDENPIEITVLAGIMPIMTGINTPKEKSKEKSKEK